MKNMRLMIVIAVAALSVACGRGQDQSPAAQAPAATNEQDTTATPAPADSAPTPAAPREESRTARSERGGRTTTGTAARTGETREAPRSTANAPRETRPVLAEMVVPAGTELHLSLETPLTTETAKIEDPVRARLRDAVVIDGHQVLPAGSVLTGNVTETERPGRVKGRARLAFKFNEIQVRGDRARLDAAPISIEGEATKSEDATKIGIGAGVGAAIGAIAGGKSGAAKGGAIGGAAGTGAVLATRGKEVELAAGAAVTTRLNDALRVEVPMR